MKTSSLVSVFALVLVAGCNVDFVPVPSETDAGPAPSADAGTPVTPPPAADAGPVTPPTPGITCQSGRTLCGGTTCCDLQTDVLNCGGCNVRCGAGQTCNSGTCATPPAPVGPRTCSRDTMDVTLPNSFHTICPGGGMSVVVHGDRPTEDVTITSDGQANPAHGVARYFGAPGAALSLSLSPGLWAGREVRISGMCARTGAWAEAGTIRLWERHATAGAAGARILFNGVDLANSCRVANQPFGESAYPSCIIPQPSCR